jgi:hypothetical protein
VHAIEERGAYGLYVLNEPADRAEADAVQKRLHGAQPHGGRVSNARVLGQPVRLTDGRAIGHVVEALQWPTDAKTRVCAADGCTVRRVATRSTVIGIAWSDARTRKLAREATLLAAADGVFLVGDDALPDNALPSSKARDPYGSALRQAMVAEALSSSSLEALSEAASHC